jgi:hypothetical protein
MNMYEMVMLMIWDVNACLTPRGVTASGQSETASGHLCDLRSPLFLHLWRSGK